MFLNSVRVALLFVIICVAVIFAAIDSAAVINGINTAGQIAQAIAQTQGQAQTGNIISIVVTAVCAIVSFIFGHAHGKNAAK